MNNTKLSSNVLKGYFDPDFKPNIPTPIEVNNTINNDDPAMLGYSIIKEIQSIDIDEIGFGGLLIETSNLVADLVESNKSADSSFNDPKLKQANLDTKDLAAITYIKSLYAMGVIDTKAELIEANITQISKIKFSISYKLEKLKVAIPKIQKIIEQNIDSPDPKIQMRVKLLQQFFTFHILRIKTIEQHLDASEKTLLNASNFMSFTKLNLTYNLQANLQNKNCEQLLDQFKSSVLVKFEKRDLYRLKVDCFMRNLYGLAVALILYSIVCLITPAKNLFLLLGFGFFFILFAAIISISIDIYDYESSHLTTPNYSSKLLRSSFLISLFLLLGLDIFIFSMKLTTIPYILLGSGLVMIACIYGYFKSKPKSALSDFSDLIFQFNEVEKQYLSSVVGHKKTTLGHKQDRSESPKRRNGLASFLMEK